MKFLKNMSSDDREDFELGLFMGLLFGVIGAIAVSDGPNMVARKQQQYDALEKGLIGNGSWWQNTIDWWRAYNGDFSR